MNSIFKKSGLIVAFIAFQSVAAGDLTRQEPVRISVSLGNLQGEHRFFPDKPVLETGKLYILQLENSSKHAYYFGSYGLADAIYSRKVVTYGADKAVISEVYDTDRN